ncbi:ABC transporter substrate-binding protein [Actinomadura welshii]
MRFGRGRLSSAMAMTLCAASLAACGSPRGASGSDACAPGITDTSIKLGQSSLQSGPGAAYKPFATVPAKYFEDLNERGGIEFGDGKKRTVEFTSYDDRYDPAATVVNVKKLVEQDQVFALYQNTGEASILAVADYLKKTGVPLLFAGTGADSLRDKAEDGTALAMLTLPTVHFEDSVMFHEIERADPSATIAVLHPSDAAGQGHLDNARELVKGTDMKIVAVESYELTAPTVDSQVTKLRSSDADVFINYGTGSFVTGALKKADQLDWPAEKWIIAASADYKSIIKPAGPAAGEGVHAVGWLYSAGGADDDVPGVRKWIEWATENGEDPANTFGAYSYNNAQLFVQIAKRMKGCQRSDLIDAAQSAQGMTTDLGLPEITFGSSGGDPSAVSSVAVMTLKGDRWEYGSVVKASDLQ